MDILCRKGKITVKWSQGDRNALEGIISICRDLGKRADDSEAAKLVGPLEALAARYSEKPE